MTTIAPNPDICTDSGGFMHWNGSSAFIFDVAEANRIILAWGPFAIPISPADRRQRPGEYPSCRSLRRDGYACWGDPGETDTCPVHFDPTEFEQEIHDREVSELIVDWVVREGGNLAAVYFIVGNGLVKIGRAIDVHRRLRELQCGSPIELRIYRHLLTYDYEVLEYKLHKLFCAARRHGEWFEAMTVLPVIDAWTDADIQALVPYPVASRVRGSARVLARWFGTAAGRDVLELSRSERTPITIESTDS